MIFDRTGKITLLFDICLNQGSLDGWIRAGGDSIKVGGSVFFACPC